MTEHEQWTDRLSDYLDGELSPEERDAVDRHLESCAGCAAVLDDLRRVVDRARSLPHAAPGEQVWQAVVAGIHQVPRSSGRGLRSRFAVTLPQLAAAGVLLAILSGWAALRIFAPAGGVSPVDAESAVAVPVDLAWVSAGDSQYDAAVADLEQALEVGRGRLDPATVAIVVDDLRIIDEALDEARRALAADPANGYLSGHVAETRRRKLDLLRRAAAMTADTQM